MPPYNFTMAELQARGAEPTQAAGHLWVPIIIVLDEPTNPNPSRHEPEPADRHEPEPEPTDTAAQAVQEPERNHLEPTHPVAAPMRYVQENDEKVTAWLRMMAHINCLGAMDIQEYEFYFGKITSNNPYGDRFWYGFERLLQNRYLRMHLYWHTADDFKKGSFRKPYPFAQHIVQQAFREELHEKDAEYPCFFLEVQPGWTRMVCIHICIYTSRPWTVHSSWIQIYL